MILRALTLAAGLTGAAGASQFPEFSQQYVQRLGGAVDELTRFVAEMQTDKHDALMSVVDENLECLYKGEPVNFTFAEKTNSQDLTPVQRIVWAVTAWRRDTYLDAINSGKCATYSGRVGYVSVGRMAGHVIKTQEDLDVAAALYNILPD